MTLGSTWGDLVVGVDLHTHVVPMVGPAPIPQPFVGVIGDPVGALVSEIVSSAISLASTGHAALPKGPVLINGLPATTTDALAKNRLTLMHLPMPPGVAHVKPPAGEATFPLGALNVAFRGASAVRLGEIGLSCSDPVPLPTSTVIAIPKGPPVMVEGAPGINVQQAVTKWAMGRIVRTAWRVAGKAVRHLARLSRPRRTTLVSLEDRTCVGDPVDVATGQVVASAVDFGLPGPLPLTLERHYASAWSARDGVLGPGWSHSLDQAVWFEPRLAIYRNAEGQEIVFDAGNLGGAVPIGRELFEPISRNTLTRTRAGWKITTAEGLIHHFAPITGETDRRAGFARIRRTTARNDAIAIAYAYEDGRLATVRDAAGRIVQFEHDHRGRLARVHLPHPDRDDEWLLHVEYRYSAAGTLVEVRDAAGRASRYDYDGALMVQRTDRNGLSFYWQYDGRSAAARCVRTWGDGGIHHVKLDHDVAGRVTLVTDSYGNRSMYRMNALGAVIAVIDARGGMIARDYDDDLHLIAETDPLGYITRHEYGSRGQLTLTTFADGSQIVRKSDPRFPELVKLLRGEEANVWRSSYDQHGQLLDSRGPAPDAWREYEWEHGLLQAVEAPGGRTSVIERDRWGNVTLLQLPNGARVRRRFDRRGRLVAETNPYGKTRETAFDLFDQPIEVREVDGNVRHAAYDPEGRVVQVSDRLAGARFTYDGAHRRALCEELAPDGTSVARTRLVHGLEGELREVRNERDQPYQFFYDGCLRVQREVAFDLQETVYTRDPAGRVVKVEKPRAGVHTDVTLDERGRAIAIAHSDGTWAKYGYRRDGYLASATNAAAAVRFERDGLGRVLREWQGDVVVTSTYAGAHRSQMESSLGARLALERDASGNPTRIAIGATEEARHEVKLRWDAAGLEVHRALPGGVTSEWHRDGDGRPVIHAVNTAANAWAKGYRWSFDDRITEIADSRFGRAIYEHDARGRLVAERFGDEFTHRTFDEVGNVYRSPDLSDRRYVRGGVLRRDRDTTFAFDALGNMVARVGPDGRTWRYAWNGAGMLTEAVRPDGTPVSFAYDALGRRVSRKVGDLETRWIWDGDVVLHERRGETTTTWYHEPETFAPLAKVEGGRSYHVIGDHLGTPTAMYDADGSLTWQMALDVFGERRAGAPAADASLCPFRWPGQQEDAETGLYYNRFRYYDPKLGLYASQDPIGLQGGLALYRYVCDPLVGVDCYGLIEVDPWTINFSQRTVSKDVVSYTNAMKEGRWDWSRSGALNVFDVNGQYVTYNNRRLMAAQNAGLATVPIKVVDPNALMPTSTKTWAKKLRERRYRKINVVDGQPVPADGLRQQPRVEC